MAEFHSYSSYLYRRLPRPTHTPHRAAPFSDSASPLKCPTMAESRGKRLKSEDGTSQNNNNCFSIESAEQELHEVSIEPFEEAMDSDLPSEVLELILARLTLKDNIHASCVCKRWLAIAISVRKVDQPPWLMQFPKSGDLFEFYNPADGQSYNLKLPKLIGSIICNSKDGWLLCFKPRTRRVFLFNPYSQELTKFPKLNENFEVLTFSAPPTSPSCVIFTINPEWNYLAKISTCRPGDTEWTSVSHANTSSAYAYAHIIRKWNKIIFCNGFFYCVSISGLVWAYNPEQQTWCASRFCLPQVVDQGTDIWWRRLLLAERNGELFLMIPRPQELTKVFKLNMQSNSWKEMEDMEGITFFAEFRSSQVRTNLIGNMRNLIYLPKVTHMENQCMTYSVSERRFSPQQDGSNMDVVEDFENVWIDAPSDLSIFI